MLQPTKFELAVNLRSAKTIGLVVPEGLMSYGADGPALFRLSAKFVHRVLQGQRPSDLPIERPHRQRRASSRRTLTECIAMSAMFQ